MEGSWTLKMREIAANELAEKERTIEHQREVIKQMEEKINAQTKVLDRYYDMLGTYQGFVCSSDQTYTLCAVCNEFKWLEDVKEIDAEDVCSNCR
jgi:DNA-binding transcriptional regulator GbsR (MarR family)